MEKAESHASFLSVFIFGWLCEQTGDTYKGNRQQVPSTKQKKLLPVLVRVRVCVYVCTHVYNDTLCPCRPSRYQGFLMNTYIKEVEREGERGRDGEEVTLIARVRWNVAWQTSASCPFPSFTFVTKMTQSLIPWLQSNERPFTLPISLSYITRLQLLGK